MPWPHRGYDHQARATRRERWNLRTNHAMNSSVRNYGSATSWPGEKLPWSHAAAVLVGLALACYLAQWVSIVLLPGQLGLALLWLPGGIVLAALAILPGSLRPGILMAAFLAIAGVPSPQGNAVADASAALVAIGLTGWLSSSWREQGANASNWVDLSSLRRFGLQSSIIAAGSATAAASVRWAMDAQSAGLAAGWAGTALAVALGYFAMAPPLMVLSARGRPGLRRQHGILDVTLVVVVATALSWFLWSILSPWPSMWLTMLFAPMTFMLWSAVRFGMWGASVAALAVTLVLVVLGIAEPVSLGQLMVRSIALQLWVLTVVLVTYVIGILTDQRIRLSGEVHAGHQQALGLAGRLIDAQEAERSRIARELHDDISQKLASFCIAASALKRMDETQMREGLGRLQDQLVGLSTDVRRLSHDLHPDVLRHAGIVRALRALFLEQHSNGGGRQLQLDMEEDVLPISCETRLCLYRVAQEALHNADKHAHYRNMKLTLRRTEDSVHLTVSDDGRGFDPESRDANSHLGLISMEERVRLVGGSFAIVSSPGRGTTVSAQVPLS
ncbi:MAG: ATP-binding protein [Pseudoxanthomonas sp.]